MADPSDRPQVAVVGTGEGASADACAAAEAVGAELGRRGAVLVCGGLGGVMEAACRGARGQGGITVGVLPGRDRESANEHVEVALATGLGEARNALVATTADVLIAIEGEFGTLSEVALALKAGKPVVGLSTWQLGNAAGRVEAIHVCDEPGRAVERALELVAARR